MATLSVGEIAPDFSAVDQAGKLRNLADWRGSWLLLYFYPEDDTPGCTVEACSIRDSFASFKDLGMAVVGVSPDTAESHTAFAKKYDLPYPILADQDMKIINAYGAYGKKNVYGHEKMGVFRMSYLIDPQGKVAKVYKRAMAETHARTVLTDAKTITTK